MKERFRTTGDADGIRDTLRMLRETLEVQPLTPLDPQRLDALHTAVAEAARNAVEHGHQGGESLPITITVSIRDDDVRIRVTDQGSGVPRAAFTTPPDLHAKLRGEHEERGWGLFLMRNLVDEVRTTCDPFGHHLDLVLRVLRPCVTMTPQTTELSDTT